MKEMITKLQEAVAHQGEDIVRLSDELYAQQKEMAEIRLQFMKLKAEFRAAAESDDSIKPEDQEPPPPHY